MSHGVKERPMLFSGAMVRAILDGSKTQTRRVLKVQPVVRPDLSPSGLLAWLVSVGTYIFSDKPMPEFVSRSPYGKPGDRLWVRETWGYFKQFFEVDAADSGPVVYCADGEPAGCHGTAWRPSIHMFRWASRILLEITAVRVERLNDISEADAIAEGINCYPFRPDDGFPVCNGYTYKPNDGKCGLWPTAAEAYKELWESINGKGSWDENPWVWVISFRRIK